MTISSATRVIVTTTIVLSSAACLVGGGSVSGGAREKTLVIVDRSTSTAGRPHIRLNIASETMVGDDETLTKSLVDNPLAPYAPRTKERNRRRLRESVRDLERILIELGANVSIRTNGLGANAATSSFDGIDVFIGRPAAEPVVGSLSLHAPAEQAFRIVVRPNLIALYGESDLASSYALYELLDQIGCRWFIPGPLGEVLPNPASAPIRARLQDEARAPSTIFRSVWFADDAWKRRNREGGLKLEAGHALETYLADEERVKHPEWTATIRGKPEPGRLHWSSPTLATAIGDRLLELYAKSGVPTFSISPNDGSEFDDSPEDRALDAGDIDPTMGTVSLTDRFLSLANGIAARVTAKQPEILFGFLAYVQYTRPPVRERLHPSLVPQIAPITYARAHPMSDDRVPGNQDLRRLVERWGALAKGGTSFYFYGYFLAELVAPNPMLTKWGNDVPFILRHNAKYWQPETLPNFETSMHALYMGMRLAFDAKQNPSDIYSELDQRFYGAAGPAMHAYWREVDRVWVDTPEYSGGMMGHLRRFSPEVLARLRALLERAKQSASNDLERKRIEIADDSLALFEEQMALRREYVEGRFKGLAQRGASYRKHLSELGEKWKGSFAFIQTYYSPDSISAVYYDTFMKPAYEAVTQIADTQKVIATLRKFRFQADTANSLANHLSIRDPRFDDRAWRTTDVAVDSWSSLGLHDYLGLVAYRTKVNLPTPGKRITMTLSMVDGSAAVFVNGKQAPYLHEGSEPTTPLATFGPLRFDLSGVGIAAGENTVVILARRPAIDELGVGGLMGPVVIHSE